MQDFNKGMEELSNIDQELGLYDTENKRIMEPITVTYTKPKIQLTCTQAELEVKLMEAFSELKGSTFDKTVLRLATMEVLADNSVMVGGACTTEEINDE